MGDVMRKKNPCRAQMQHSSPIPGIAIAGVVP